ncbi:hypothetical protein ACLKA7_007697 [Drosophila subpalustris]
MVMGKLNKQPMPTCETTLDAIVRHLFPQQLPLCALVHLPGNTNGVVQTTASEVMDIAANIKPGKSPAKQEAHSRSSQLNPAVRFQNLGSSDERAYVQPGLQGRVQAMCSKSSLCSSGRSWDDPPGSFGSGAKQQHHGQQS